MLKSSEIRYLTYTSESLNRFLDRPTYQTGINLLQTDIIEDIEVLIAEEILTGYFRIRNFIKHQRNGFLKQKNKQQAEKAAYEKDQESRKAIEADTLYKRVRQQQVARTQSEKKLKEMSKDKTLNLALKYAKRMIKKTLMKKTGEGKLQNFVKRNTTPTQMANSTFHGKIPIKVYRSIIHPTSKLLISPTDQMFEGTLTMSIDAKHTKSENERAYQIKSVRDQNLINSHQFVRTYSSGPQKGPVVVIPGHQVPRSLKVKAAIVIQKYWRSFIAKRRCRHLRGMKEDGVIQLSKRQMSSLG